MKIKSSKVFKILAFALCFFMAFEQSGFAQVAGQLDISGRLAALSNSFVQDKFRPLHLRYLQYDPQLNNFKLFLDKGNTKTLSSSFVEESTKTLLQYFLVGVTLPNDSFWVNLRPDSPDNVIDPLLGQTDVGKILLEADVQLKKDTAKFTSPETPEGKEYWDKLYEKAGAIFGSQNVTIPTLTRPWIVPDEIILRETSDNAYVYKATLKVMLEDDYLKGSAIYNFDDPRLKELNTYASSVLREKIIPKLTQEVNASKKYAALRQVYYSLILAQWFKQRFNGKGGQYASLIDRKNLSGLVSKESWSKNTYFQQYQKSFKDGEYNFKVPMSTPYGQVIRSYFSGGIMMGAIHSAIVKTGLALKALKQLPSSISKREIGVRYAAGDAQVDETFAAPLQEITPARDREAKAKTYAEKFIEQLGVYGVSFGGVKKLNNPKARAEVIDDKIFVSSDWLDKMSEDELERVMAHEVQHTLTNKLMDEKGLKIGGLHEYEDFKDLQQRIGNLYDKREKGILGKPKDQYQANWELLSLLRGYQVYLEQKERSLNVVTQPYEFIEAFKPEDLKFLDERYLFEITKNFKHQEAESIKITYEDLDAQPFAPAAAQTETTKPFRGVDSQIIHGLFVNGKDGKTIYVNRKEIEVHLHDFMPFLDDSVTVEQALRFLDGHETLHALIDKLRSDGKDVSGISEKEEEELANIFGRAFALLSSGIIPADLIDELNQLNQALQKAGFTGSIIDLLEKAPSETEGLLAHLGIADINIQEATADELEEIKNRAESNGSIIKAKAEAKTKTTDHFQDFSGIMKPAGKKGVQAGSIDGTEHEIYIDSEGNRWLFKAYPPDRQHRAFVDQFVYNIAKSLGMERPVRVFIGRIGDKIGTFVQWVENSGSLWNDINQHGEDFVKNLSKEELEFIIREQVLDWLVSQHDSHGGSFLKGEDGKLYAIDKSQAFKYMGFEGSQKEGLNTEYNPNSIVNGSNINYMPIYNIVLRVIAEGKTSLSLKEAWDEVDKILKEIEQLDTSEYIALLTPYAEFRFDEISSNEEQIKDSDEFLRLARERKENIRKDFEKFYSALGLRIVKTPIEELLKLFDKNKIIKYIGTSVKNTFSKFNQQPELNRKMVDMYGVSKELLDKIKNVRNAGNDEEEKEAIVSIIEEYYEQLLSGIVNPEEMIALEKEKQALINKVRGPPGREVKKSAAIFRILVPWIKEMLREFGSEYHRVYFARDAGYLHLIDNALENSERTLTHNAGSSVYHLSTQRMTNYVYGRMHEIIDDAKKKTKKSNIEQLYGNVRSAFRDRYNTDLDFKYIVDAVKEELEKLGYDKIEKILLVDTGFTGTMPFFVKNILDLDKDDSEIVDNSGKEKIRIAIITPANILEFAEQLFGFKIDNFSKNEKELVDALRNSYNMPDDRVGAEMEFIKDHPIMFNKDTARIEHVDPATKLRFFHNQIIACQMVANFLSGQGITPYDSSETIFKFTDIVFNPEIYINKANFESIVNNNLRTQQDLFNIEEAIKNIENFKIKKVDIAANLIANTIYKIEPITFNAQLLQIMTLVQLVPAPLIQRIINWAKGKINKALANSDKKLLGTSVSLEGLDSNINIMLDKGIEVKDGRLVLGNLTIEFRKASKDWFSQNGIKGNALGLLWQGKPTIVIKEGASSGGQLLTNALARLLTVFLTADEDLLWSKTATRQLNIFEGVILATEWLPGASDITNLNKGGAIGKGSALDERSKVETRNFTEGKGLIEKKIAELRSKVDSAKRELKLSEEGYKKALDVLKRLEELLNKDQIKVFDGIVRGKDDFLLAFAEPGRVVLMEAMLTSEEFIEELAEILFHEGAESLSPEGDHEKLYKGIQRDIFGSYNALGDVLRNYITRNINEDQQSSAGGAGEKSKALSIRWEGDKPYADIGERIEGALNNRSFIEKTIKNIHGINDFNSNQISNVTVKYHAGDTQVYVYLVTVKYAGQELELVIKVPYKELTSKNEDIVEKRVERLKALNKVREISPFLPKVGAFSGKDENRLWSEEYVEGDTLDKFKEKYGKEDINTVESKIAQLYYLLRSQVDSYLDDPKPQNFVISKDEGVWQIKLVDVGEINTYSTDDAEIAVWGSKDRSFGLWYEKFARISKIDAQNIFKGVYDAGGITELEDFRKTLHKESNLYEYIENVWSETISRPVFSEEKRYMTKTKIRKGKVNYIQVEDVLFIDESVGEVDLTDLPEEKTVRMEGMHPLEGFDIQTTLAAIAGILSARNNNKFKGKTVIDFGAGSGILGLLASGSAEKVIFVESDAGKHGIIERNAKKYKVKNYSIKTKVNPEDLTAETVLLINTGNDYSMDDLSKILQSEKLPELIIASGGWHDKNSFTRSALENKNYKLADFTIKLLKNEKKPGRFDSATGSFHEYGALVAERTMSPMETQPATPVLEAQVSRVGEHGSSSQSEVLRKVFEDASALKDKFILERLDYVDARIRAYFLQEYNLILPVLYSTNRESSVMRTIFDEKERCEYIVINSHKVAKRSQESLSSGIELPTIGDFVLEDAEAKDLFDEIKDLGINIDTGKYRKQTAESAINLVRWLKEEGIRSIVLSGGSALISYELISLTWEIMYPEEKLNILTLSSEENEAFYKTGENDERAKLLELIKRNAGDKKLAFVDDYISTGTKLDALIDIFSKAGVEVDHYGFISGKSDRTDINILNNQNSDNGYISLLADITSSSIGNDKELFKRRITPDSKHKFEEMVSKPVMREIKEILKIIYNNLGEKTQNSGPQIEDRMLGNDSNKGGIDFRALPITTQPMGLITLQGQSPAGTVPISIVNINLDKEWQEIENMLNAGIKPSLERIREYLVVSCKDVNCQAKIDQVLSGLADILRMEEESSFKTEKELKAILMLLESNKSAEQLSTELLKISIMPLEPMKI